MKTLEKSLEILKKGREFLSTYENWCPYGSVLPRKCAYVACNSLTTDYKPFIDEDGRTPTSHLGKAFEELYGDQIISVNDGLAACTKGKTERERWEMVLAGYDRAIANVKAELETGKQG